MIPPSLALGKKTGKQLLELPAGTWEMEYPRLIKGSKHPRCCRRGTCALVGAVTAFVPPSIHLRAPCWPAHSRDFLRARVLRIHSEMGIQAAGFLAPSPAAKTNPFVPSYSSAADSGNLHKQQLMGKRLHCPPSSALQRKGSHSLPQSCPAPTVLRQRGPKPVAKSYLRHGRQ